jgi:signal transduction histidine kinase
MLTHVDRTDIQALDTAYRLAFQRSDEAIAILGLHPRPHLVDATDCFLETWRLSRAGAMGRPLEEIFTRPAAARLLSLARKALSGRETVSTSLGELATASARLTEVDVRANRLPGDLVSIAVVSRTPLADARRHALIDDLGLVSGGLIYIYDLATQQTRYINSNLVGLLGYGGEDSVSLAEVLPLVHPDDVATLVNQVEQFPSLADGEVNRGSFRIRNAEGEWRWIDNRAGVFARGAGGEVRRVIGYAFDITTPRRTMADLAATSAALLNVEEKERRRIARELHDSTAQHLVAADLMLASHERRLGAPDPALSEARDILALALREIRTLSFLLHPPRLREQGLAKTLRTFAEGFARRAVLDTRIEISEIPANLAPEVELALFRVAQEALMNVRRHADADCVRVRLGMQDNELVLEIEDDGVGIGAVEAVTSGVGVDGMRARLSSLDGELTIENAGRRGTRVRAAVRVSAHTANSTQNSNSARESRQRR